MLVRPQTSAILQYAWISTSDTKREFLRKRARARVSNLKGKWAVWAPETDNEHRLCYYSGSPPTPSYAMCSGRQWRGIFYYGTYEHQGHWGHFIIALEAAFLNGSCGPFTVRDGFVFSVFMQGTSVHSDLIKISVQVEYMNSRNYSELKTGPKQHRT